MIMIQILLLCKHSAFETFSTGFVFRTKILHFTSRGVTQLINKVIYFAKVKKKIGKLQLCTAINMTKAEY